MEKLEVRGNDVKKAFARRTIFDRIKFGMTCGDGLAIIGRNGSGKSTLVKIIAGVLSPTSGSVDFIVHGKAMKMEERYRVVGFVSPYLQLYDEFTGIENLRLVSHIRGLDITAERLDRLLEQVNLLQRKNDEVRTYSSGMKQRLKYALALLHRPPILILDEPSSNLDDEGVAVVQSIMERQKQEGILVVAANDAEDIRLCDKVIDLNMLDRSA